MNSFEEFVSHTIRSSNDSLSEKSMIVKIRVATEKFKSPENARNAGYRPMGPDMPNMGMHWINTGLAVQRSIDFEKPSTLTYLPVDGELKLTGVAYTTPVNSGEKAPELPIKSMTWHYHSGNLEEEAHGVHNEQMQFDEVAQMNLAMLHAWVWSDNPAGTFSADNWALSYYRFGLKPPNLSELNPELSKALFLASGNVDYYLKFIELSTESELTERDKIKEILTEYSSKINDDIKINETGSNLSSERFNNISKLWKEMWDNIKEELDKDEWANVEMQLDGHRH